MRRLERNSGANQLMALAEKTNFGDEEYMFLEGEFPQFETSVGPVTGYGNSPAFSFFRPVIPEGMVLDTTVIPQDNIVFLPTKSSLETQLLAVVQEKIKQRAAFIF